jgi:hypothetical protein
MAMGGHVQGTRYKLVMPSESLILVNGTATGGGGGTRSNLLKNKKSVYVNIM